MSGSDDGKILHLEVNRRCGDQGSCSCPGEKPDGGVEVKKGSSNQNAVGFVSLTHYLKDGTISLKKDLDGGDKLEGSDVSNVKDVSVYYWEEDKEHTKPLLIEVNNGEVKPRYYKKSKEGESGSTDTHIWKLHDNSDGTSLQALLDDRNCVWHNVIPFYLDEPEKGIGTSSDCAKNKNVEFVRPSPLSGSEYMVTEYKLNGDGSTRFSRVMLDKDRVNGIIIPNDIISNIRLYSSPINDSATPIMFEFVGNTGGDSKWYFNQGGNGIQWPQDAGSSGFYNGKDNLLSQLTEKFTKKLDGLVCEYHNGVTIDLSHSISTSGGSYCCDQHKGKGGMVTVEAIEIKNESSSSHTTVYRHSIKDSQHKLVDIKFYKDDDQSQRRHIQSTSLNFPIPGPVEIYTFYSNGSRDPKLIYVHKDSDNRATGWYQMQGTSGNDRKWKKTYQKLKGIDKGKIESRNLGCQQWNYLVKELKHTNSDLQECPQEIAKQQLEQRAELRAEDGAKQMELAPEELGQEAAKEEEKKKRTEEDLSKLTVAASAPHQGTEAAAEPPTGPPGAPSTSTKSPPTASHGSTPPAPSEEPQAAEFGAEAGLTTAATSLWLTFGASSGTLTGAGGLTGLGWWAFKRSRGDPWVRQI
ncbi:hypothetical protein BEWA_022810 [Theileria equi strain WA]|uniref:Uncharacterized protein n=1 Tax=Theileria equi strain WA TaxID=1537102 RepID=L0AW31_THEEQ|nr:hypothetical protein BEWA_022810 [Theileria equi strain WA]AFZ79433.1 hypothetical protein BEWA_022810 [Theileria equi strain WA]|eukprot:XP_004829099.1 hypothetical protein BEWA_022810 [Theileria equi strain WA]